MEASAPVVEIKPERYYQDGINLWRVLQVYGDGKVIAENASGELKVKEFVAADITHWLPVRGE